MKNTYQKTILSPIVAYRRQWNADGRGKLIECLRNDDDAYTTFGQTYVTTIKPGIIKAWHYHEKQTDRMMLLRGLVRFVGYDMHEKRVVLDFIVDEQDPHLIVIPKGIYHGFQNVGTKEAYIINTPDHVYNRNTPDEIRTSPYTDGIPFAWDITMDG